MSDFSSIRNSILLRTVLLVQPSANPPGPGRDDLPCAAIIHRPALQCVGLCCRLSTGYSARTNLMSLSLGIEALGVDEPFPRVF